MRRLFSRTYGTVAVTLPLLVVATAIVQAEGATPAPQAAATPGVAGPAKLSPDKKNLNTVPEDGIPGAELLAPNKIVRDFMAKRPNEDLIVCVAGCYSHRDKVVYAQPMEPKTPAPAPPVAEAAPAAPAAAPAAADLKPSSPADKSAAMPVPPPASTEKVIDNAAAAPTVINAAPPAVTEPAAPAADDAAAAKDADVRSQMLPTMSEPEGEGASGAAAPEAPSEEPAASDSDVPPESRDSER